MTNEALKHISEADVVREVKVVIKATGIKLQRINTGCFKTGDRFIKTAEAARSTLRATTSSGVSALSSASARLAADCRTRRNCALTT